MHLLIPLSIAKSLTSYKYPFQDAKKKKERVLGRLGAWLGGLAVCLLMMMLARTRTKAATILHFLVKHQQRGAACCYCGRVQGNNSGERNRSQAKGKGRNAWHTNKGIGVNMASGWQKCWLGSVWCRRRERYCERERGRATQKGILFIGTVLRAFSANFRYFHWVSCVPWSPQSGQDKRAESRGWARGVARRVESSGSIKVSEVAAMPLKCLTMQNKLHLRCSIMHVYSMSMIMFALLPDRTILAAS